MSPSEWYIVLLGQFVWFLVSFEHEHLFLFFLLNFLKLHQEHLFRRHCCFLYIFGFLGFLLPPWCSFWFFQGGRYWLLLSRRLSRRSICFFFVFLLLGLIGGLGCSVQFGVVRGLFFVSCGFGFLEVVFLFVLELLGVGFGGVAGEGLGLLLLASFEALPDLVLLDEDARVDHLGDVVEAVVGADHQAADVALGVLGREGQRVLQLFFAQFVEHLLRGFFAEDETFLGVALHGAVDAGVQQQLRDLVLEDHVLVALDGLVVLDCDLDQATATEQSSMRRLTTSMSTCGLASTSSSRSSTSSANLAGRAGSSADCLLPRRKFEILSIYNGLQSGQRIVPAASTQTHIHKDSASEIGLLAAVYLLRLDETLLADIPQDPEGFGVGVQVGLVLDVVAVVVGLDLEARLHVLELFEAVGLAVQRLPVALQHRPGAVVELADARETIEGEVAVLNKAVNDVLGVDCVLLPLPEAVAVEDLVVLVDSALLVRLVLLQTGLVVKTVRQHFEALHVGAQRVDAGPSLDVRVVRSHSQYQHTHEQDFRKHLGIIDSGFNLTTILANVTQKSIYQLP